MDNGPASLCNKNGPTRANGAYASSINADDSRLNWDRGDMQSASIKTTIDVDARSADI